MYFYELSNFSLNITEGDLTLQNVDAIVNAANTELILGGGVAGAIKRRGGPSIQEECYNLAPIHTGEAVITKGGNLVAKYVIHTAGPIYDEYTSERADELLNKSVLSSLNFLDKKDINSISFPAISAGIYGFPAEKCAEIMISTIVNYMKQRVQANFKRSNKIKISICLYGSEMFDLFQKNLEKLVSSK
jgi:O-acetyl-ADP-ribose deacetylase